MVFYTLLESPDWHTKVTYSTSYVADDTFQITVCYYPSSVQCYKTDQQRWHKVIDKRTKGYQTMDSYTIANAFTRFISRLFIILRSRTPDEETSLLQACVANRSFCLPSYGLIGVGVCGFKIGSQYSCWRNFMMSIFEKYW